MSENFDLVRGDDKDIAVVVRLPSATPGVDGKPVDLTGALIMFTAKRMRDNGASVHADPPVIRKTSDDTSEVTFENQATDEGRGRATVILQGVDTKFLQPGIYLYDIQLRTAQGRTYTIARGRIYLQGDVTAAEDLS